MTIVTDNPIVHKLPNALREALLQAKLGNALLVVEGLYMLGFRADTWLLFEEIYQICRENFGMSRVLVYKGLLENSIFQRRKQSEDRAHQAGPRPYLYRLPHPDELIAEFAPGAESSPHDELHSQDLRKLKTYRQALHHQMFVRKWIQNGGQGFEMSRKLMADRLGVSVRTIRDYDKQLEHSNTPNYKQDPVTDKNWFRLPRYKDKYDSNGKRLPSKTWLRIYDPQTNHYTNLPLVRYLAYRALQGGYQVFAVERLCNTYYPYLKPDVNQFDSWDVTSLYFVDQEAKSRAGLYQHTDDKWYPYPPNYGLESVFSKGKKHNQYPSWDN